jgi:hypothetical protein
LRGEVILQGDAEASRSPGGMCAAEVDDPLEQRLMGQGPRAATAVVVG